MMKTANIIKAFIVDFLLTLYIIFGFSYLLSIKSNIFAILVITLTLTIIGLLRNSGVGSYLFLQKNKINRHKADFKFLMLLITILTFAIGWKIVQIDPIKFFTRFPKSKRIISGLLTPNIDILKPVVFALIETIYLALMATVLAIPFAFFFSFLGARNLMPKTFLGNCVFYFVRTSATIVRSIEAIVWAIIFSVWVGIGPFAGMLALMFHSIAALTKLYSEQIENIDNGQIEAIRATGANEIQVWIYGVIPQIISPYFAFTFYRWDINVRMATIVGFVGGGGIGLALKQQQDMLQWHNVGTILWLIAFVVWIMDMTSSKIRQNMLK